MQRFLLVACEQVPEKLGVGFQGALSQLLFDVLQACTEVLVEFFRFSPDQDGGRPA